MKFVTVKTLTIILACMLTMLMMSIGLAEVVESAPTVNPGIELSTQYPTVVAKAGDNMTFSLDIDNQSGVSQDIALSIISIPENWTGTFSASSRQVSTVHVKNDDANTGVSFALDIPLDAEDGDYEVIVKADADGFSDEMMLRITLDAEEIGESSLSVEYPSQEGDDTTAFDFSATLINNTLSTQSYSFSANAPSGWTVSFTPSGESTKVAAIEVEARSTQGLEISVTPPEGIEAGTYEIACAATSAAEKVEETLSVTITGSYALTLSTPSGRLSFDAYANRETEVQLNLTNEGNTELTNVNLTSNAPTGWNVRFASETIELIEAGATVETTAYITPGEDAMSGDYVTTLTARNSNTSDTAQFRVTVKTETKWGFVGIGIIVLLALVVAGIMRKYGRR